MQVTISQEKTSEDEKWDGLKGYLTNTDLSEKEVYEQFIKLINASANESFNSNPLD